MIEDLLILDRLFRKKKPLFHIQNSFDKVQESWWKCGCFFLINFSLLIVIFFNTPTTVSLKIFRLFFHFHYEAKHDKEAGLPADQSGAPPSGNTDHNKLDIPDDLLKDFLALRSATNLGTADLMRRLISDYSK